MLTIGERINATRKAVAEAVRARDEGAIRAEIDKQLAAGALMIDLNGGTTDEEEPGNTLWLTELAVAHCAAPLCIDSANPPSIEAAIEKILAARGGSAPENFEIEPGLPWLMLNSISAEEDRYARMLPLVKKYNCAVTALCMSDDGMPSSADERVAIGSALVERLGADGIEPKRVYMDPLVVPVSVNTDNGLAVLEAVRQLKAKFPELRIVCGLSNVSYGLPARGLINRIFLSLLVSGGLDAAILDACDVKLMSALRAALLLCGRDPYCAGYIKAFREQKLDV